MSGGWCLGVCFSLVGFFFTCRCIGWVIVVVEGRVSIGVGLHIRITYILGSVGCGRLQYCGITLRV